MVFAVISAPILVQANDKFRINFMQSYSVKGSAAITTLRVDPGDGMGFVDVSSNRVQDWFFDYQYSTPGTYTVIVEVSNGVHTNAAAHEIQCISEAEDALFSSDRDLVKHESEILSWMPQGRSSFKYVHRRAQELILDWLHRNGYRKSGNLKLEKSDLIDIKDVKEWSTFLVLALIFQDNKKQEGDTLAQKSVFYYAKAQEVRPLVIRADWDNSGQVGDFEGREINTIRLVRY